jgi:hypothetical protein
MTIAAAFLTPEGVVFGADSTTQQIFVTQSEARIVRFFNNAQKVFEIGPPGQGRLGLCTWGNGLLGTVAHRTVAANLADRVQAATTVREAVDKLVEIAQEPEAVSGRMFVGYFLGGIDARTRQPACYKIELKEAQAPSIEPLSVGIPLFMGAPRFFNRAEDGFDPDLPGLLKQALISRLSPVPENFDQIFSDAFAEAKEQLPFSNIFGIPLRDAIDFVHAHLHLTVKAHKFLLGPPVCGGQIELAFVSSDRAFRWVRHKPFDSGVSEVGS